MLNMANAPAVRQSTDCMAAASRYKLALTTSVEKLSRTDAAKMPRNYTCRQRYGAMKRHGVEFAERQVACCSCARGRGIRWENSVHYMVSDATAKKIGSLTGCLSIGMQAKTNDFTRELLHSAVEVVMSSFHGWKPSWEPESLKCIRINHLLN